MATNPPYILITDGGADFPADFNHSIPIIPFKLINKRDYSEIPTDYDITQIYKHLTIDQFIAYPLNLTDITTIFRPYLAKGYDILYLAASAKFIRSYTQALVATWTLRKEFPNRRIECVDSRCISGGQALIFMELHKLRDADTNIDTLISFVNDNWRKVIHLFSVDNLKYLYRDNRVGFFKYLDSKITGSRPLMHFDSDQTISAITTVTSNKQLCEKITNIAERIHLHDGKPVYIHYGNCPSQAYDLRNTLRDNTSFDIKCDRTLRLGRAISADLGPTAFGAFFWGKDRDHSLL